MFFTQNGQAIILKKTFGDLMTEQKKVDGGALKIFRIVMLDLENPFESLT